MREKTVRCARCHEIVRRITNGRSTGFIGICTEFAHYSDGCGWGRLVTYDQTYDEEEAPPNPLPLLPCERCQRSTPHAYLCQRMSSDFEKEGYLLWYRCKKCGVRRIWGTSDSFNREVQKAAEKAGLV